MNLNNCAIAVIRLGYVGLLMAAEVGKKLPVIGLSIRVRRLRNFHLHAAISRLLVID